MAGVVQVNVHPSVFPEKMRRDLLQSLRARRIDPKLHYATYKQSRQWLALHEAHSPARTDSDCLAIYERAFISTLDRLKTSTVHLIGLGCGGGQKDAQFLQCLQGQGRDLAYSPCDVSLALVLTASQAAAGTPCHPLICDLAAADDLLQTLAQSETKPATRVFTFFGMIPNFEPEVILPKLAALIRPEDFLLFSANLAPGADYAAGVEKVLSGYDNALTRDWLLTFLHDLGAESGDGTIEFSVEDSPSALKRIVADYRFSKPTTFTVEVEEFQFHAGDKIRLFFSYRHTPDLVASLLAAQKLNVLDSWTTTSGEEAVFLCQRAGRR